MYSSASYQLVILRPNRYAWLGLAAAASSTHLVLLRLFGNEVRQVQDPVVVSPPVIHRIYDLGVDLGRWRAHLIRLKPFQMHNKNGRHLPQLDAFRRGPKVLAFGATPALVAVEGLFFAELLNAFLQSNRLASSSLLRREREGQVPVTRDESPNQM